MGSNLKKNELKDKINILFPFSSTALGGSFFSSSAIIEKLNEITTSSNYVALPYIGDNYTIFSEKSNRIIYDFSPSRVKRLHRNRGIINKIINIDNTFVILYKAFKILKSNKIDIVHINDDKTIFIWGLVSKLLKKKVIWHIRQLKGNYLMDRFRLFVTDYVIFNSIASSARFAKLKREHKIIYNGFDLEKVKVKKTIDKVEKKITIGYLSNFIKGKGVECFLDVAKKMSKRHHHLSFVIGGNDLTDGIYVNLIQNFIDENPNLDLEYLGFVSDINVFYNSLDIFFMPSTIDSFGRVFVESMLRKVPVVGCESGGVIEIIEYNISGFLVDCSNPTIIIEKLSALVNNNNLRGKFSEKAYRIAIDKFSLNKSVNEIFDIYQYLK